MTRRTVGTRSASSATSATWTTTSCSSTCAVTTTSATSATLTGPRTTTGGGGGGAGKGGGAGWPRSPLTPVPDSDYAYLREHFREKHFLCEEGRCSAEQFTHAFRTDIDLKAHRTACHSRSRAEARQNRQIDLQFSYAPRHSRRGEGERGPPSAVRGSRGGSQPRRPDSGPDAASPAGRLVAAGGALGVLCGGAPPPRRRWAALHAHSPLRPGAQAVELSGPPPGLPSCGAWRASALQAGAQPWSTLTWACRGLCAGCRGRQWRGLRGGGQVQPPGSCRPGQQSRSPAEPPGKLEVQEVGGSASRWHSRGTTCEVVAAASSWAGGRHGGWGPLAFWRWVPRA